MKKKYGFWEGMLRWSGGVACGVGLALLMAGSFSELWIKIMVALGSAFTLELIEGVGNSLPDFIRVKMGLDFKEKKEGEDNV